MTDLAAIASARAAAQSVEAEARALADELVAAKRERRRLRRDLAVLPGRVATTREALAAARVREESAAQARAAVAAQHAAAEQRAASAEAAIEAADAAIALAEQNLQEALAEDPRPPAAAIRALQDAIRQAGVAAAAAGRALETARTEVAALAVQLGTAGAALQAARAETTALAGQLAELEAALADAGARRSAVEARPGELVDAIGAARERVRAAWEPWTAQLGAAHGEIDATARARSDADARLAQARLLAAQAHDELEAAARLGDDAAQHAARAAVDEREDGVAAARAALAQSADELDRRRRELLGELGPEDLVALVAGDVPLVLLPVRLETRIESDGRATDLLVRVYPDTIHASSHEPELTPDEAASGQRFVEAEQAAAGDDFAAEAAWRQLADRFGAARAAWIAHAVGAGETAGGAAAWTRAPSTAVLPDRWIALGYRDGERRFAVLGRPIPDTLAVGPDPYDLAAGEPGAPLGDAASWLVDFDRALETGMALRIELGAEDAAGLDRLVVLGVRATGDADDGERRLAGLLDAHHYTDGLALVPPGMPTNNTASARSAWTASGAAGRVTERGAPLASNGDGSDADRLARALGVDVARLAHVSHADATSLEDDRHMATALWPVTWGYMLGQLSGAAADSVLDEARAHAVGHVRSHGAQAALRVGRQPYGVLPATSLERFGLLDPADVDAVAPPLLRALVPAWRAAAAAVPHVTSGAPLEDVLVEVLSMSPVSVTHAARGLALQPPAGGRSTPAVQQDALAAVRALGLDLEPLLARAGFEEAARSLTGPLVARELSERDPLPAGEDYIAWLADSSIDAVRTGTPPAGANTLLFALLRHALLRAYADAAVRIARDRGVAEPGEGAEPGTGSAAPSPWTRLAAPLAGVTGGATLAQHLDAVRAAGSAGGSPAAAQLTGLVELQAGLRHLSRLPSAQLARLLAGNLDLASHRLDAWITAHAGRRLEALRDERPRGARIGGYGVVEDVRPGARPAGGEAIELAHNHGYVHAPSLGQAATAAILRSGHLAHRNEADSPFAVDLSSQRVRLALRLLDGVRAGQSLAALLGYRFERALHEGHPGLELDRHIATLRGLAPLDELTRAEHDLAEALRREADVATRVGRLEAQLAAEREADTRAREALQTDLARAESERVAAVTEAREQADARDAAEAALQALLDDAAGGTESPVPAWKFGEDDAAQTWIRPALRPLVLARARALRTAAAAFDAANARAEDAARRVAELSARLGVANAAIAALEQAVTDLHVELERARAAVAVARAKLDELDDAGGRQATEAARARNVVDGLALRGRWRTGNAEGRWDATTIPFGDRALGLPAPGTEEHTAVEAELRAIDDAVDALSDLLLAESVHHLVQGNPLRAGATVDALSRGDAAPPEIEVVRTPRAGTGVTHRLVVLLDPAAHSAGWPTDDTQVRAVVEPALEAWAARVLGPAARVRVRTRYAWADGEATGAIDLSALRLSALDLVAMSAGGGPAGATELELRLIDHAARTRPPAVPEDAAVELDLERESSWTAEELGVGELLELARELHDLLAGARALDAHDLALPGERAEPGVDDGDLAARAAVATRALDEARAALALAIPGGGTVARRALLRASMLGVQGSIPVHGEDDLAARCAATLRELERRAEAAAAATDDRERIAAVLGEDFRVLARVHVAGTELTSSLSASEELQGGDRLAAVTWLQRSAHVREGAARLEGTLLYAEAVGSPERLDLRVAQLPFRAGDRWAALPHTPDRRIEGGRLSLVAQWHGPAPEAARPLAGLLVDEWTEVVPESSQVTGLSFHFDQPSSRAPQAILLAVPPTEEGVWSLPALEAVVVETLELARLRLVDPDALAQPVPEAGLPRLGHYLPAAYVAAAPVEDTVTTDLGRVVAASG